MLRDMRGLETIMEIEELLLGPLFACVLPQNIRTAAPHVHTVKPISKLLAFLKLSLSLHGS